MANVLSLSLTQMPPITKLLRAETRNLLIQPQQLKYAVPTKRLNCAQQDATDFYIWSAVTQDIISS